jgi:hypothetical protein
MPSLCEAIALPFFISFSFASPARKSSKQWMQGLSDQV